MSWTNPFDDPIQALVVANAAQTTANTALTNANTALAFLPIYEYSQTLLTTSLTNTFQQILQAPLTIDVASAILGMGQLTFRTLDNQHRNVEYYLNVNGSIGSTQTITLHNATSHYQPVFTLCEFSGNAPSGTRNITMFARCPDGSGLVSVVSGQVVGISHIRGA